jgi:CelD/BcsL family acetyltransferase involved in cellulose biosynthesis
MTPSSTSGGLEQARTAFRRPPQQLVRRARPRDSHRGPAPVHRVEWIEEPGRFAELREQWDWLAARQPAPFGRHAWFWAWWNAFGTGGQLSVCAVWRGKRLVAVLPLWRRGGVLRAMANVHTPVFQVPACDHQAREAAFTAALKAAPGSLELEALASTDPALPALARDSRDAGRVTLVESLHTSPIIDLKADFAAYTRLHPTRCRKLAKLGRKMWRDHEAEVALLDATSDLEAELDRAFALESAGWKGAAGTAIVSAEETAHFYRSVASAYQRLGELRLSTIVLDGELAAFDLCLLHGNRLWTLKGAYNESYRRLSPGMVLLLWEIERSFELGLEAVELLGGIEEYKLAFATSERKHLRFRAYRRRPAYLARFAYRRWARPALRNGYRQLPRRSHTNGGSIQWSRLGRGRSAVPRRSAPA